MHTFLLLVILFAVSPAWGAFAVAMIIAWAVLASNVE